MKGRIRDGSLVEAVAATARREQTWLWASADNGMVAGYYRFFDTINLFLLNQQGGYYEIEEAALQPGESLVEIEAVFGRTATAFLLKVNRFGQQFLRTIVVGDMGRVHSIYENRTAAAVQYDTMTGKVLSETTLLHPTDEGIVKESGPVKVTMTETADWVSDGDLLHLHPDGLLIQQAAALYLVKRVDGG
jgi:hypothetical protein